MASFKRTASAIWKGTGPDGTGTLNGPSGLFQDTPYSAKLRFQNEDGKAGTNPEELIAAAHAGRLHPDHRLAGAGGGIGELHDFKLAVTGENDTTHQSLPSSGPVGAHNSSERSSMAFSTVSGFIGSEVSRRCDAFETALATDASAQTMLASATPFTPKG